MPTYQRQFVIAPASGSIEYSLSAISGSIGVIANSVNDLDNELDGLRNKPLAIPQTERSDSILAVSYYRVTGVAPVFAGYAGATAAMVVSFVEPVIGNSGNELTIVDITSDAAGLNSVVGTGYVLNPYIHFSEPVPGVVVNLRYGIQSTLGGLPEGVLLVEPMKIAEVQADTQSWIAAIKGTSYDTPVAPTRTLIGLDSRVGAVEGASQMLQGSVSNLSSATVALDNRATALENKVGSNVIKEFGLAPEFANMVFDNSNLVNTDGIWLGGADMGPTSIHTFLEWSTNVVSTPQSNRVRVMVKLPHDFGLWHPLMPIRIWYKGDGDASKIGLNVTVFDEFATVTNISSEPMLFGANIGVWNQHVTSAIENGVFAPNQWICLTFETTAEGVGNTVKIGRIDCKYLTA